MSTKIVNDANLTSEEIKELRNQMGMTQFEFAIELDTTPQTILNWENGHSEPLAIYQEKLKELRKKVVKEK